MEFLQVTDMPQMMSVMELSQQVVQILCVYANNLPTESGTPPQAITDMKRKTMFYNKMSKDWKTMFTTRSNLRVSGMMSITQMMIYFNSLVCTLESAKSKQRKTYR
jgi:hypothetical protein